VTGRNVLIASKKVEKEHETRYRGSKDAEQLPSAITPQCGKFIIE
jgi:hypothetical protein